jgi:hypothetical protein
MAVAEGAAARFEIGRVVSRTFGTIGHNFLSFALLALVPAIPAALMYWSISRVSVDAAPPAAAFNVAAAAAGATAAFVYYISAFLFQASVVHGAVAYLNGKRATVGDCLSTGLANFLPVILMSILVGLGVLAGLLLVLVPGIILALAWSVAVPVRVVEHANILDALKRSRELTYGHRWAILGLIVVFFLIGLIVSFFIRSATTVAYLFSAPAGATGTAADFVLSPVYIGTSVIVAVINLTIGAAGLASIYYELRLIKEGIGPEALASVFD